MKTYRSDVVIAGAGIAGLITAYELLKRGKRVIIFDKDVEENLGGLAREAFGGIHIIDTPEQRVLGIQDTPALAFRDWQTTALFDDHEVWPKKWAEFYCYNSIEYIYNYYSEVGLNFLPGPLWTERGVYTPSNTVPRWHLTWGTGHELVIKTVEAINALPHKANLQILFDHEVNDVKQGQGAASLSGKCMKTGELFEATGDQVIIASGGIGGGDLTELKKHWPGDGRKAPDTLLNGAHRYGDGLLHRKVESQGGAITNLKHNWPYAAGVHHPERGKPFDGISLQPGPGILWFNAFGERVGPMPLFIGANTNWLVNRILDLPGQYSWLIMNWRLATRELIVSLSRYATAIRNKDFALLVHNAVEGDEYRINLLLKESPEDVFLATDLDDLVSKMQQRSLYDFKINGAKLRSDIRSYDAQIDRGTQYHGDEQLRRIANYRAYQPGGLVSYCDFQKILDPAAGPLLAARVFVTSRKSLGGIQTNLDCEVLKRDGTPFENIYAVGEASGYGGGGSHGKGAPEGAFLGGCILTARVCGRRIP